MAYIVKMPKLGMEMNRGTLLEWLVSPGEAVSEGTPVAEVESEKSVAEITASEDGTLRLVYVSEGEAVPPGTALGIVAGPEESVADLESRVDRDPVERDNAAESAATTDPAEATTADGPDASETEAGGSVDRVRASPKAKKRARELEVDLAGVDGSGPGGAVVAADVETADAAAGVDEEAAGSASERTDVRATPKAKRRARDLDVDLADVEGSGPKGAVTDADLDAAVGNGATDTAGGEGAPETETRAAAKRSTTEERDLSGMRQTIADRLGRSYREAVHVTVSREIPVGEALAATDAVDGYLDVDVSVTDVVLVALSATLGDHPEFNATFEDGVHRIHGRQNVGVAVDVDAGLITPVLSAVDEQSLGDLVCERRELTDRARSGEYTSADLSGGTFTVTNLGMFGVDSFTPIINPPEVAILGVSRIRDRPVRTDDGVGFERVAGFDLAFDHRVVDGADAARFLDTFETYLTDPWPLLLDRAR